MSEAFIVSRVFGGIGLFWLMCACIIRLWKKRWIPAAAYGLAGAALILFLSWYPLGFRTQEQADGDRHRLLVPRAGKIVVFGSWEQDNDPENGPEPISWQVLDVQDNEVLMTSFYTLDRHRYAQDYANCTWAESDMRLWLNTDFYQTAFTPEEQARILETPLVTAANTVYDVSSGEDTVDRIFLLSVEEVKQFMPETEDRTCSPTPFALAKNAFANEYGNAWWMLRTSGENGRSIVYINSDGTFNFEGCTVNSDGGSTRPALRIRWE